MLDPTFVAADAGSIDMQVSSLQAEVDRLRGGSGWDDCIWATAVPPSQLQAMIFAQQHAERAAEARELPPAHRQCAAKVAADGQRCRQPMPKSIRAAQTKEGMRKQLEQMQIGSKLNTLDAGAQRAEVNRTLQAAIAGNAAAKSDLDGLSAERDAYVQQIKGERRSN